jgi:hypothetical protein
MVESQFCSCPFLRILTVHLVMTISCCTFSFMYKLCIRNKPTNTPTCSIISLFPEFTFALIPTMLSLCQRFLNVTLLSTHDSLAHNKASLFLILLHFSEIFKSQFNNVNQNFAFWQAFTPLKSHSFHNSAYRLRAPSKAYYFFSTWQKLQDCLNLSFFLDIHCVPNHTLFKLSKYTALCSIIILLFPGDERCLYGCVSFPVLFSCVIFFTAEQDTAVYITARTLNQSVKFWGSVVSYSSQQAVMFLYCIISLKQYSHHLALKFSENCQCTLHIAVSCLL